ncbi:MAG: NAD(P)-dependent oxidoreductase [Planctomycetaceae bacterium]
MTTTPRPHFHATLTADFYDQSGKPKFRDLGLDQFDGFPHVLIHPFTQHQPVIQADQLANSHGVVVLTPGVTAQSLQLAPDLLVVARFGVGYDSVDVDACTNAGVLVTITAGAVDRPVAEATVGWMIALSHHVLIKDRLVRTGQWHERTKFMGRELRERQLGIIGLGGIGRELLRLLQGFGMQPPLVFDPFLSTATAAQLGVRLVSLTELLQASDFVSIHCPLTDQTRGLIGATELALMRSDAWLLNTARGGIVDEDALEAALDAGQLAGAALDCFRDEPVLQPSRFARFDNVLLAPHSIAWTDELFRDIGRMACRSLLDVSLGRRPHGLLNPTLLNRPEFRRRWSRITGVDEDTLPRP